MQTEVSSKFYRVYVATMLTIAVVLLAVLVGGLWYGSLRVERATTTATKQIKNINNSVQQVQGINKGVQTLNNNLQQLNTELHAVGSSSFNLP